MTVPGRHALLQVMAIEEFAEPVSATVAKASDLERGT
jgi:hypothetical protein